LPVIVFTVATPPARLELRQSSKVSATTDDRIGRRGQGRAGPRSGERRRGGRAERQRSVAAEQRGLLLAHRLLQQAQRGGRVNILEALRRRLGLEGHRVFFAERQVRRDLRRG
jgi:hypothetical protein